MLNKAMLIGRLGKDPQIKELESGSKIASFSLATDASYKDKQGNKVEKTEWTNIVYFGKQADLIERYVKKGSMIYVEGKISTRSYEKDGQTKYVTEIIGNQVTFLGGNHSEKPNSSKHGLIENNDLPF